MSGSGSTGAAKGTAILGSKGAIISAVAVVSTVAGIIIGSQFMDGSNENEPQTKETVAQENTDNTNPTENTTGGTQVLKNEIIEREEKEKQEEGADQKEIKKPDVVYFIDDREPQETKENTGGETSGSSSAAMDLANSSNYDPADDKNDAQPDLKTNNTSTDDKVDIVEMKEDQPYVSIVASPIGGYAPLHVSFKSDANYDEVYWDFDDGTTSKESNPAHVFYEIGTYEVSVRVTTPEGQTATDKVFIEVKKSSSIEIPNVFTPNNDGVNDQFIVVGKKIKEFNMKIFDRKGNLLFETNDMNNGWSGKDMNRQESPEDTYFYIINAEGEDGKQFKEKGSISLFR